MLITLRYESIELVGYAGIYNGMALPSITLDLTLCKSNKIIIRGSNGSGKSTIMSAIHLLPDSNEKFVPTMEARKVLVLVDGNNKYIIRYIHPIVNGQRTTAKGFIAKSVNGSEFEELNPSGMINNCKELIYDEFSLDASFISLSQLSSEDRGLVDRRPGERKKMINSIINSIETFNEIYKNISKKSMILKNLMTNLTSKIDMIGSEAKLSAGIANLSQQIDALEADKQKATEAIAAVKLKIANIQETLNMTQYNDILAEINLTTKILQSSLGKVNTILENLKLQDILALQEYSVALEKRILIQEMEVSSLNTSLPSLLSSRESEVSNLQNKKNQLASLQSDFNYTDIKQILEVSKQQITEFEAIFAKMGLMNIQMITKDEFNAAMKSINNLRYMTETIMHNFPVSFIIEDIHNRQLVEQEIASYNQMKQELENAKVKESQLTTQSAVFVAKREIAKELINRPSGCKIDTCVYIAEAVKADRDYPEQVHLEILNELKSLSETITVLSDRISKCEVMMQIRQAVDTIERELMSNIQFIRKLPVRPDFQQTFLERALANDPFDDLVQIYNYVDCGNMIEEYKRISDQIKIYETELKVYQSKSTIIESLITDISVIEKKISEMSASIDSNTSRVQALATDITNQKMLLQQIQDVIKIYNEQYKPASEKLDQLNKVRSNLDIGLAQIRELEGQLQALGTGIGSLVSDIKALSEQREALKHSLLMLADYRSELDNYTKQASVINKLKYYSSPNTGISSVYVSIFMNKILATANEFLSYLFAGEFAIQQFIITPDSFLIPVVGDGLLHDDVSSMSSAQRAMISMIITFAIIHQTSNKYNIVTLDEYDGCMDQSNRFAFVQLLDRLMYMVHSEQAFIVSHNNELDTSACDIIALKNTSNEIINGNVIWKF